MTVIEACPKHSNSGRAHPFLGLNTTDFFQISVTGNFLSQMKVAPGEI